ncbi:uncharacterized protein LOC123707832 [Pieris brassicae]|uniref:Uncharacterized protein n=1 Tax=Pieris brassicae TaxID=7116 RepID=A0A9P0X8U1_PIEBR|nr:uncharacterized protein LOC123707832 [Pieris brassicae]CAH4022030.1 unnamed protein product [Pieris brassicae]
MQFNQPINSGFQNEQFCPYYAPPLPYTDIVGEGNVASLMFPDGTVQFFFIPSHKRERRFYPYHPSFGQVQGPVEAWFIRQMSSPTIPNTMENMQNGDPFLRSYFTSKPNLDLVPQKPYYQKFHSDNVTSTTDIHYFFPRKTTLKHSAFVQVEHPAKYSICSQTDYIDKTCFCPKKIKNKCEYTTIDSSSAMSIDDEAQTKERRKNDSKVRFKTSKSRERKICFCKRKHDQGVGQSDKKISTYTDQSINCAGATSQNSQTSRKGSNNSIKPNLPKSNSKTSCDSCCRTCFFCVTDCTSDGF